MFKSIYDFCNNNLNPLSSGFKANYRNFSELSLAKKSLVVVSTVALGTLMVAVPLEVATGFSPFRWAAKLFKRTPSVDNKNEKPEIGKVQIEPLKIKKEQPKIEPLKIKKKQPKIEKVEEKEPPKKPSSSNVKPNPIKKDDPSVKKLTKTKPSNPKSNVEKTKEKFIEIANNTKDYVVENFQNSTDHNKVLYKGKKYEEWNLQIFNAIEQFDNTQDEKDQIQSLGGKFTSLYKKLKELSTRKAKNQDNVLMGYSNYEYYHEAVKNLTKELVETALKSIKSNENGSEALNALCYIVVSSIKLDETASLALNTFNKIGKKEVHELTFDDDDQKFLEQLTILHESIDKASNDFKTPQYMGVFNQAKAYVVDTNPIIDGDLPYVAYDLELKEDEKPKTIKSLRLGSVTQSVKGSGYWPTYTEELRPEFKGFLEVCKDKKEKHLTVFYGDNGKKKDPSLDLIKQSALSTYVGVLHYIELSKESGYYIENKNTHNSKTVNSFKRQIVKHFMEDSSEKSGITIPINVRSKLSEIYKDKIPKPSRLTEEEMKLLPEKYLKMLQNFESNSGSINKYQQEELFFEHYLRTTIDDIVSKFFNGRDTILINECQPFVDILYDTITRDALVHVGVDSFNIINKNVDVSSSANAQLYTNIAVTQNPSKKLSVSQKKKVAEILFVPTLNALKKAPSEKLYKEFNAVEKIYLKYSKTNVPQSQSLNGKKVVVMEK